MWKDKVVLITGASRGLGKALAQVFASEAAQLVIAARTAETLEATRREVEAGGAVLALSADMTQADDIVRVVAAAIERFGRIDVLINNAGTLGPAPRPALLETDPDALLETLRVNTVGPLRVTQAVLPHMLERGSGLIVNITSDAARGAYPEWGAYGASKAALELIGLTWAAELAGSGVRVLNVDPGDLQTDMQRAAFPGEDISDRALPADSASALLAMLARDPDSGRYSVWDSETEASPGVREMRVSVTVDDLGQIAALFRSGLDLPTREEWSSPDGRGVILEAGRATLELVDRAQAEFIDRIEVGRRVSGQFRLALEVADVAGAGAALQASGARALNRALLTPWGDFNQRLSTPDGIQITLFQPHAEAPAAGAEDETR